MTFNHHNGKLAGPLAIGVGWNITRLFPVLNSPDESCKRFQGDPGHPQYFH